MGRLGAVAMLVCGLSAVPLLASAQVGVEAAAPEASDVGAESKYEALLVRAVAAFEGGAWVEAHALFLEAHHIHSTARTLRTMGMASFNAGNYVRALAELDAALTETEKPLTEAQRAHVTELIGKAHARTGRVELKLEPADAVLLVDGRPARLDRAGQLSLEPGPHEFTVRAEGHRTARRTLAIQLGQVQVLEVTLEGEGSAPVSAADGPSAPADPPGANSATSPSLASEDTGSGTLSTLGLVTGIVGGVVLAAGLVAGGLAYARVDDLDRDCPGRVCPDSQSSELDGYDRLRIAGGLLTVGGAALVLAGIVLVWADAGPDETARASEGALALRVRPSGIEVSF